MVPSIPSLLLLPALFSAVLCATSDRFSTLRKKSFPIKLDDAKFPELIAAPRDYTSVVLLTAMGTQFGCQACHEFQPEWDVLARAWQKGDKKGESRTIFADVDFLNGRNTFQSLGLQHAPVVFLYPPTTGPNAKANADPIRYDFQG